MKGHHVYRIGAALSVDGHPEHAIIWLEKACGVSGYDVRVVERHEARPREVRAGPLGAWIVRSCLARRRTGPSAAIWTTAGDEKERGYTNRCRNADGTCSDEYLQDHLTVARHDTNQTRCPYPNYNSQCPRGCFGSVSNLRIYTSSGLIIAARATQHWGDLE